MRDPILDDPNTFYNLLDNMPKELKDRLNSVDPEVYELDLLIKRLLSRGRDHTTNEKCRYRVLWAFWQKMEDWRDGYRYKTTVGDRKGYLRDWENIRLLVEDGPMDHDILEDDKKRLSEAPLFQLFADQPALQLEPEPDDFPLPERHPVISIAPRVPRFDVAYAQGLRGVEMIKGALRPYDCYLMENGCENMPEEAQQYVKSNPKLWKRQDHHLLYRGGDIYADTKTARYRWDCFVEFSMFMEAVKRKGVLFFVYGIDSEEPFLGAAFAEDVFNDVVSVELRHKPSWCAAEYYDKRKEIEASIPHAKIDPRPVSEKLSNDPGIVVSRSGTTPLNQFVAESLKIKKRNWSS